VTGWRILGFGKHPEIAAAVQEILRSLGFQATTFVLTNDAAGDARLVAELQRAEYDGVAIGGYINGQDAVNFPATEEMTVWFNRVLNLVHANAPRAKIILVRGPEMDWVMGQVDDSSPQILRDVYAKSFIESLSSAPELSSWRELMRPCWMASYSRRGQKKKCPECGCRGSGTQMLWCGASYRRNGTAYGPSAMTAMVGG
jgi:hypothetical protein